MAWNFYREEQFAAARARGYKSNQPQDTLFATVMLTLAGICFFHILPVIFIVEWFYNGWSHAVYTFSHGGGPNLDYWLLPFTSFSAAIDLAIFLSLISKIFKKG